MSAVRAHLAEELSAKVERHGIVIWDDPEKVYADVVEAVAPALATVASFSGSWFELRRQIEHLLAGDSEPHLVVYVPAAPLDPDPLEELRATGSQFRLLLPTLLKNALAGQMTERRIDQIAKQCSTLAEAEAALEGGESKADARLISLVGESSTQAIAERLLTGTFDAVVEENRLGGVEREFFSLAFGGDYGQLVSIDLHHAAFRQIVLTRLDSVLGAVPEELSASLGSYNAAQRKTTETVLERLQTNPDSAESYAELARSADQELHLGAVVKWMDDLMSIDLTPAIEHIAIDAGLRMLSGSQWEEAGALAGSRLTSSWWVRSQEHDESESGALWRAIRSLAELGAAVERPLTTAATLAGVVEWYAKVGWEADTAFRRSELIRVTSGVTLDELDELYSDTRRRYEAWLDSLLTAAANAAASDAHLPESLLQRGIHRRHIRNGASSTAYVLVDALRFELGLDLADRLLSVSADVTIDAAVATPPTITPVGMAAVVPGADVSFQIGLGADDRLEVTVDGHVIRAVKDRVDLLEQAHGTVIDLDLDRVALYSNKELKKTIDGADLVLVRSTEIDADGEADQLAASWGSFDNTLNILHTAVAKLLYAGVKRVVITADHGFLAVRQLGEERRIDRPATGSGELHRRAWIGRGGTATPSTVKLALAEFGITSDLDIITPRGLGVFTSGGGLQFFHGGLSPQELVIPVLTITSDDVNLEPTYDISLSVAGNRITTGVVAVTITMAGDLFTSESRVRLQLSQNGERKARVVGGDGVDTATEFIEADVAAPRVITMQVTGDLVSGSTVTLEVLDAATGVRLGERLDVGVAANVIVEEEL